jgi:hypothetical protein
MPSLVKPAQVQETTTPIDCWISDRIPSDDQTPPGQQADSRPDQPRVLGVSIRRSKMNRGSASSAEYQTVRVWTIQRAECWKRFERQGVLRADGRRVCEHFRPAYRWLMEQMARRVVGYTGASPCGSGTLSGPICGTSSYLPPGERGGAHQPGVAARPSSAG